MEKFYIVPKDSRLGKDFIDYENNRNVVNDHVKQVCEEFGVESSQYMVNDGFLIVPTQNDLGKFSEEFTKKRFD